MAGWLAAIPVIGELFSKVTGVVSEAVTDKDKANELSIRLKEILSEFLDEYYEFVAAMEGQFKDLIALGTVGKILAVGRAGWRIVLQWTLTIDIMTKMLVYGQSWTDLKEEILFTLGLAALRTVEKKLPFPRKG